MKFFKSNRMFIGMIFILSFISIAPVPYGPYFFLGAITVYFVNGMLIHSAFKSNEYKFMGLSKLTKMQFENITLSKSLFFLFSFLIILILFAYKQALKINTPMYWYFMSIIAYFVVKGAIAVRQKMKN